MFRQMEPPEHPKGGGRRRLTVGGYLDTAIRNGAVASAVPSALTRAPARFDWQLAGATRSGTAGVGDLSRSNYNDTPVFQGKI